MQRVVYILRYIRHLSTKVCASAVYRILRKMQKYLQSENGETRSGNNIAKCNGVVGHSETTKYFCYLLCCLANITLTTDIHSIYNLNVI